MTISEARAHLPEVVDRVLAGEEVTLTRHGQPVAVVVRPDALRTRRAERALSDAEKVRELLERGRSEPLARRSLLPATRADELAASVRRARDKR